MWLDIRGLLAQKNISKKIETGNCNESRDKGHVYLVLPNSGKKRCIKVANAKLYALVLAGGSGTRLWPLSRKELPKQFLCLEGERTLFQNTLIRLLKIVPSSNIKVISGNEWSSLINHQAKEVGCSTDMLINEPAGRSTAPAIALGIAYLIDNGASKEDIAIVCPTIT